MKRKIFFLLLGLFFLSGIHKGAEYYVSPGGSDSTGTGSISAPFATVQFAVDGASSGDTITLRGGNYSSHEIRIRIPHVTLRSYPGEWAVITAPTNTEDIGMCIYIDLDASYTTLQNLEIVGGYYYAIKTESNWDWGETPRYGSSHILIEGCRIHGSGRDCIKIVPGSDYVTIRQCTIYGSGLRDNSNAEGIDNVNGDYMLVQDCHIHDTGTTGIYAKGGAMGMMVERCLVRRCGGLGIAVGFDTSPEWFDTSVNPGYYENIDGIVRNCVIIDTTYAGIGIYAAKNAKIMNNTIINTAQEGQSAIHFGVAFHDWEAGIPCPGAVNVLLKNNILVHAASSDTPLVQIRYTADHTGISGLTGMPTMSHNRYYIQGGTIGNTAFEDGRPASLFNGTLSQWQGHISGDASSSQGDPGLNSHYHLASGSACINQGTTLGAVTEDYDGNLRTGTTDIGADEYNAGPALPIPPPVGTIGTGNNGGSTGAVISLSRGHMVFTATTTGTTSGPQNFQIANTGSGTLNWNVSATVAWLACTPGSGSGTGAITVSLNPMDMAVGTYTGTIAVSSANASNSPRTMAVTLKVVASSALPFGSFDSPLDNTAGISGSIAVTGWVLDDIGVQGVKIYRADAGGLAFVGDAVFVEGARPDIELAYPDYPHNSRAGWGYMMLTNFLPGGGNGTFTLYAIARDVEGGEFMLGTKTIQVDNAHGVKPFGAIDTPLQGGEATGNRFVNWGWVLTPQPNSIPTHGATINVMVDGVNLGHPTYNLYRSDIASLFPGYANQNGAVGYFYLNTTGYTNGVHTIQWTASDTGGNTDGIGSRYFTIQNGGSSRGIGKAQRFENVAEIASLGLGRVQHTAIKEMAPVQIHLSPGLTLVAGYMVVGPSLKALPIGATLAKKQGVFYWLPGPGFIGEYRFVFIQRTKDGDLTKEDVIITIAPKF